MKPKQAPKPATKTKKTTTRKSAEDLAVSERQAKAVKGGPYRRS